MPLSIGEKLGPDGILSGRGVDFDGDVPSEARTVARVILQRGIVLSLLLASALSIRGETLSDFGTLRLRATRKPALGSGDRHRFRVNVDSGQYFHVAVEKKGIDLVLSVVDPKGREVVSFSSPNGAFGFEDASVVAEQGGAYTVEVTAKTDLRLRGQYRITLRTVRAPTEEDRLELQAQTTFRAALSAARPAESLAQAAALFERLHERYWQALSLHRLGLAYEGLSDPKKALEAYSQALPIRRAIHDRAGEGATLTNIGALYRDRGDKAKALQFLNEGLKIRRRIHDRAGQAVTLLTMATVVADSQTLDFYHQALAIFRDLGDRLREGICLTRIGDLMDARGDQPKALDAYSQALTIFRERHDRAGEARMLSYLGWEYSSLGKSQQQLDAYTQALAIYRDLGDRTDEAIMLNNLGEIYGALSQPQKALELFEQALEIRRAEQDQLGEAAALDSIGSVYNSQGEKPKALEYYDQALAMRRKAGDRTAEAKSLVNIGTVYSDLGEPQKALEFQNHALAILGPTGDPVVRSQALNNIGHVYSDLGDKRKALEFDSQSLQIKHALGDLPGEAKTLHNMAAVYFDLGDNQKAFEFSNRAVAVYRSAGDRVREAGALCNTGVVYSAMGQNVKALDLCNQALTLDRAAGARPEQGYTLMSIGTIYSMTGEQQQALEHYQQALVIHQAVGDRGAEASALNEIARAYSALGDKPKALATYQQSLALFRTVHDRWDEARVLGNLGNTYWALGEKQKALESYDQAVAIFRAGGDRRGEAGLLDSMGEVDDELGEKQKALDFYNQALPLQRALGDLPGEGRTLSSAGSVYDALGEKDKALDLEQQALAILRSVGDRENEAATLANLEVLYAKTQPDLAVVFGKQAVNVIQSVRRSNQGLEASLRRSYEKSIESYYRNLASLLIERQRFGEAEEILSLLKEKEASDFVQRDAVADKLREAALSDSEKAALARYDQVVAQVVTLGKKKAALLALARTRPLTDAEASESQQYDRDLGAANTVVERFLEEEGKSLAANSAQADRLEVLRRASRIQSQLAKLGPDVVAIYTVVLPDRYVAMLVTAGSHTVYTTAIQESDLNAKIFEFRQRLQNRASDPLPLAREIYRIVFPEGLRQNLDAIDAHTIMWSVDGPLRYIPIAALHDGQDYLVKRFRNSLFTPRSMSDLAEQPESGWQGLGYGMSKGTETFPALDSVPAELHGIFRTPGGQTDAAMSPVPGTVRLDKDFTRSAISRDLLQLNHRVVHIATHFDSRSSAEGSNLLLGDGTLWNLREISAGTQIFDGVDLLTLSACSTAFTNQGEDGKEVDSLATLAQDNGARSVIASLWSVSDEATARLMQAMYRLLQQNPPIGKSEALRQAQAQMLSGTLHAGAEAGPRDRGAIPNRAAPHTGNHDWTHPYFWAPFILMGNWK